MILIVALFFRGQKKSIPATESPKTSESSEQFSPPSKENVPPEIIDHISMLKKKVDENPNDVHSITFLARFLMDSHKFGDAILYFERGAKLAPKDDSLLFDLSVCYYQEKQYPKAMEVTEKILSHNKNNIQGLLNKGIIFAVQGKKQDAAKLFHHVVTVSPSSHEAILAKEYLKELGTL